MARHDRAVAFASQRKIDLVMHVPTIFTTSFLNKSRLRTYVCDVFNICELMCLARPRPLEVVCLARPLGHVFVLLFVYVCVSQSVYICMCFSVVHVPWCL